MRDKKLAVKCGIVEIVVTSMQPHKVNKLVNRSSDERVIDVAYLRYSPRPYTAVVLVYGCLKVRTPLHDTSHIMYRTSDI